LRNEDLLVIFELRRVRSRFEIQELFCHRQVLPFRGRLKCCCLFSLKKVLCISIIALEVGRLSDTEVVITNLAGHFSSLG
jgi:hypothetical protein